MIRHVVRVALILLVSISIGCNQSTGDASPPDQKPATSHPDSEPNSPSDRPVEKTQEG